MYKKSSLNDKYFFQASVMSHLLIFSLAKPKDKGQEVYSSHHEAMLMNNPPRMMWKIENNNSLGNLNKLMIKSPHSNQLPSLVSSGFLLWLPRPCLLHHRWAQIAKRSIWSTQREKEPLFFWKVLPSLPHVRTPPVFGNRHNYAKQWNRMNLEPKRS